MSNNDHFYRNDLIASAVAVCGAAVGAFIASALSLPNGDVISCGIIGCVIGQFLGRWWLKRKPSEDQDGVPVSISTVRSLSIWISVSVALGLLIAYFDGMAILGLVQSAGLMALFVVAALGTTMVAKRLQRRKQDKQKRQS